LWIAPTAYFVIAATQEAFLKKVKENFSDITNVISTLYGWGSFILAVVLDIETKIPPLTFFANLLLPAPSAFSFCNLPFFRDDPETAPLAIGTKLVFDFIGDVGGGVLEVIQTSTSHTASASATA